VNLLQVDTAKKSANCIFLQFADYFCKIIHAEIQKSACGQQMFVQGVQISLQSALRPPRLTKAGFCAKIIITEQRRSFERASAPF
jgi:hypothetical protein